MSLAAASASSVIVLCQWSGAPMRTASISLSSRIRRWSATVAALMAGIWAASSMRGSYTSETATICCPGRSLRFRMSPRARPPVPITPMRMRSFAPSAEADTRVPASRTVAPRDVRRKRRRPDGSDVSLMGFLLGAGPYHRPPAAAVRSPGLPRVLVRPAPARGDGGRDPRDQDRRIEGLRHQVRGAGRERARAPVLLAVPADDDDGNGDGTAGGRLPELADELQAVRDRHRVVGEHHVRVE